MQGLARGRAMALRTAAWIRGLAPRPRLAPAICSFGSTAFSMCAAAQVSGPGVEAAAVRMKGHWRTRPAKRCFSCERRRRCDGKSSSSPRSRRKSARGSADAIAGNKTTARRRRVCSPLCARTTDTSANYWPATDWLLCWGRGGARVARRGCLAATYAARAASGDPHGGFRATHLRGELQGGEQREAAAKADAEQEERQARVARRGVAQQLHHVARHRVRAFEEAGNAGAAPVAFMVLRSQRTDRGWCAPRSKR